MDSVENEAICEIVHVVNRRQRRKNRIVKKLMMSDNRRKSSVEKLALKEDENDS